MHRSLENFISITNDGIFTKKIPTVKEQQKSPYGESFF
jgi:hypothetical protein